MKGARLKRMALVIAVSALVGAIAGIAGSAAAPSKSKSSTSAAKKKAAAKAKARAQKKAAEKGLRHGGGPGFGFGPGPGGPALRSESVVPNADGTGFDTVTMDSGTFKSVDGTTVHLKQATDKAVYKEDAAIDVGADAKVIRNHAAAKLSDLKEGDEVRVIRAPQGNVVIAEDAASRTQEKKSRDFGHDGPPPGAAPGAPEPREDDGGSNENGSDSSGSGDTNNS